MYSFLRKNNKKLMAVFAAFLMVAFVADIGFGRRGGRGGASDTVAAHLGSDKIYASELREAEQEWKTLTQLRASRGGGGFGGFPLVYRLGQYAPMEIQQHPRLFLLLQREAQRMGVGVSADRVNEIMVNDLAGSLPTDKATLAHIRHAIANLLLVEGGFERASSVVKVSEPAVRHELAERSQNIIVNAVEFPGAAYAAKTPAPTTQQATAQFEKYANTDPKQTSNDNPFGFGYRYPNRVKLQYISLPHADVRKAVEASKSDYEWEVEAQKYYLQNQSQFPTTQKSPDEQAAPFSLAGPTTAATRSTTQSAAGSSTTRPFAEVKEDAKGRVVTPEVERKVNEIQHRIAAIMAADNQAFRNAGGAATQLAATAAAIPNSSQGVPYNTYDYMQRLAQTIQKEFKVLPTVAAFDDKLRTSDELTALPSIGPAMDEEGQTLTQYATTAAQPFLDPSHRDDSTALALFAPSRTLRDNLSNVYVFRLTAADPAHAPASAAELGDAVANDVKAAAEYEQAKADATKALEQARQSGLKQAAQSSQKSVLTVGPFPSDVSGKLPGLELKNDASNNAFARGAFKLLSTATTREGGKPVGLVELPKEGKVFVVELTNVQPRQQMAMMGGPDAAKAEIERGLAQELQQMFQIQWFNFDDAKKRLGYVAAEPQHDEPSSNAPRAPIPRPLPL